MVCYIKAEPGTTQAKRKATSPFEYRPQSLEVLKTLLKTQSISVTAEKATGGQAGHQNKDDPQKPKESPKQQNRSGCRLVWFRTLAFQANDPGFKSRRPHHNHTRIQVRIPADPSPF